MKVVVIDTGEPFPLLLSEIIDFPCRQNAEPSSELWENAEVTCKSIYKPIEFSAQMEVIPLSFIVNLNIVHVFLYSH